jgi:hypothetical protein
MSFTLRAITPFDELAFKGLWFRLGEQAAKASAIVTLQQQSNIPTLVARFECGLRCHWYNITHF